MVNQYEIWLIALDPTLGHEIRKTRPCLVVSPDEMNHHIATVIIAPMTTKSRPYPSRVSISFQGKAGWIVLDQLRTVDQARLIRKLGAVELRTVNKVKQVLKELLVD